MTETLGHKARTSLWSDIAHGYWLRVRDWMWYFAPGFLCCMLCWTLLTALSVASVQAIWQRKSASQLQLSNSETMLSAAYAEELTRFRLYNWKQATPGATVAMPARAVVTAALVSLTEHAPATRNLTPAVGPSVANAGNWAGLLWLDQRARHRGLLVEQLQRTELEVGADDEWVAMDIQMTGSLCAMAGFFDDLALSHGAVRADYFAIDVAHGRADLRLLYSRHRSPSTVIAFAGSRHSHLQPQPQPQPQAHEQMSLPSDPAVGERASCSVSVVHETSSARDRHVAGQATLWRADQMSLWWRPPGGALTRAGPGVEPGYESSGRLSP